MKDKVILFSTNPHGAQSLRYTEEAHMREGLKVSQQLFTLSELHPFTKRPRFEGITMTGEELDSLCNQWAKLKRKIL